MTTSEFALDLEVSARGRSQRPSQVTQLFFRDISTGRFRAIVSALTTVAGPIAGAAVVMIAAARVLAFVIASPFAHVAFPTPATFGTVIERDLI